MWPDSVQGWLTLIASALGLLGTLTATVHSLLKRYKTALIEATSKLDEVSELIEEQKIVNTEQAKAIETSINDRGEIRTMISHLIIAQQTQMRIEIDKLAERALTRGCITSREMSQLSPLWKAYEKNRWNDVERGKVEAALALPLIPEEKARKE
ncbi:MAG: hypothetical protein Q4E09_05920 [Eubacteriales bacterium]|nr:hypothetical protein [Eubacteriales bacterium]